MSSLATLSILRLPDSYFFQFQLPGAQQPATILAAIKPLPEGLSALPQQIEEAIHLLNRLIVQRQSFQAAKTGVASASGPATDLLQNLGRLLYNQLVPPVIQQALHSLPVGAPLLLNTNRAEVPWELLHDGEQFLALKYRVGRQMLVDTLPRATPTCTQRVRTALLIGNPTGDLPQAEQEIEELLALLETIPAMAVPVVLMGARAGKDAVLKHLVSGDYDLIHYSGHALFAPTQPQASGLVLADGAILTADLIKQNLSGQPFVFLNGCASARSGAASRQAASEPDAAYLGLGIEGLATAFLHGGARSFVGTFWPIADVGSQAFALAFHRAALQGETTGAALHQARQALVAPDDPLWASYALYGDPRLTFAPAPAAKAQPATVLVIQLGGLSALLGEQPPETAAQLIEAYLLLLTQAIQRYGGQLYGTAHDTIIALFGIPSTQENDAERAVHAALDILAATPQAKELPHQPRLMCSMGLATGDVLVNLLPDVNIHMPLITSAVVDVAVQLARQAAPGVILLTEATRRLTRYRFQLEAQTGEGAAQARTYRVLGHLPESDPFWSLPGQPTALIGRQLELATLHDAWRRTCQGQGQLVDIVGEAGVGKSRLLQAFHESIGAHAQWLVTACPSAYAVGAYWLIGQLARALLGVTAHVEQTVLCTKLQAMATSASAESLAVLGDVLGVDFPGGAVRQLDQQLYQQQLIKLLEQWLVQQAATIPVVIVLEDLHRADDASLTILKQLVTRLDHAPILVIALFRLEGDWQSPWRQRRNHRLAPLKGLEAAEGRQLLAALLQTAEVTETIAQLILAAAEGNPFFIRELVFSLREAAVLRCEQGAWQWARSLHAQDIPDSLERLIWLRMNSVSEAAQSLLALLAVAGDSCEYTLVAGALAGARSAAWLETTLDQLVDKELISRRWEQGKEICRFPHALMQSVIYASLRSEERRRYHRRLAQTLAQIYQGRASEVLELLAHHAYQSVTLPGVLGAPAHVAAEVSQDDLARAAGYLVESGAQANRRYAARQAIRYYQQALQVVQALTSEAASLRTICYEGLGDAYDLLGDYEEAIAAYRATYDALAVETRRAETSRRAADLLRRIGRLSGWLSHFAQAHAYMQQALQMLGNAQGPADLATAALIHTHTGSLYYLQGELDAAMQACQQALTLVDETTDAEVAATAFNVFGVICEVTGQWSQAVTFYERSRDIWQRLARPHQLAQVMDNLGTLYFYQGNFALAEQYYQQNLAFWQKMEARDNVGYAALNLGSIYLVRGQSAAAEGYYTQALAAFQESNNQKLAALTHNNLGFLELSREKFEAALTYFQQSIAEDPSAENYRGLSEAEEKLGQIDQALAHAQQSLDLARTGKLVFEEGVTLRRLGNIYSVLGDEDAAYQHFQESLAILRKLGARYEVARTLHTLADLLQAKSVDAHSHLAEARSLGEEIGIQID